MWPFDLRGPEFLLFYVILGVLVELAILLLRHSGEPEGMPKVNLSDPYLIAFLRGGKNEVLRVVTMSLIDRGLLVPSEIKINAAEGAFGKAASELEQKVVKCFNPSADAVSIFKMKDADAEMYQYEQELIRLGLLPDDATKQARLTRMWAALVFLLGIAILKLVVALTTGHTNVIFLILLAIFFTVVIVKTAHPRRTKSGDNMIEDLRTLFDGLKHGASAGPQEFALMAAVFGMATIPTAKKLFPQAGSSGCGSSCGSSGDGGGSSCGGGGCGGCGGG